MGAVAVARPPDNLTASAIGSCVVTILYDPASRIGAMAHAMLPSYSGAKEHESQDTKYMDAAIDEMIKKMVTQGAIKGNLEARLVGGANMFPKLKSYIGRDNVLSAKKKLEEEGIEIVGECVGGSVGRSVEFSVASGIVTVTTKF